MTLNNKTIWISGALVLALGLGGAAIAQDRGNKGDRGDRRGAGFEQMIAEFDANGDGAITQEEVDTVLAERFAAADTNGDGLLSADEAFAAAEARRAERMRTRTESMVSRLDADGDGLLSADEVASGGPASRIFDRLDANDDGTLSAEELERAKTRMGRRGEHHGRGHHGRGHGADSDEG